MSDSTTPPDPGGAAGADPASGLSRPARFVSVGSIWALALALAVVIGTVAVSAQYGSWLSLALATCVIVSMCAQLATQQKDGFVDRLAASVTGAFVILGVAGGILALVTAAH